MKYLLLTVVSVVVFSSCIEEDLAFEVVESPVLGVFNTLSSSSDANLVVEGTFYELDKSGILDNTIGIDSIELSGLEIRVFVNETIEVQSLMTDGTGNLMLDVPKTSLDGASRIEWVGTHDNTPFRIYYNF